MVVRGICCLIPQVAGKTEKSVYLALSGGFWNIPASIYLELEKDEDITLVPLIL